MNQPMQLGNLGPVMAQLMTVMFTAGMFKGVIAPAATSGPTLLPHTTPERGRPSPLPAITEAQLAYVASFVDGRRTTPVAIEILPDIIRFYIRRTGEVDEVKRVRDRLEG
jgi:hypothetical protein